MQSVQMSLLDRQPMASVRQVNVNEGDKKGNVERWLLEVQDSMIKTLTKAIVVSGYAA